MEILGISYELSPQPVHVTRLDTEEDKAASGKQEMEASLRQRK